MAINSGYIGQRQSALSGDVAVACKYTIQRVWVYSVNLAGLQSRKGCKCGTNSGDTRTLIAAAYFNSISAQRQRE